MLVQNSATIPRPQVFIQRTPQISEITKCAWTRYRRCYYTSLNTVIARSAGDTFEFRNVAARRLKIAARDNLLRNL